MEVDYLILADGAQIMGDKLYMLGGGWTMINAQQFPAGLPMAIVVAVLVGWNETNRRHQFKVEVVNEDSATVMFKAEGEFEAGRPPGIKPGIDQRVQLAFNSVAQFEKAGQFVVRAYLNGHLVKKTPFLVNDLRAGVPAPPPPETPGT